MNQTPPASPQEAQASLKQQTWADQVRSGAGWLFIIALLSAINSVISFFGGDLAFVVGLGFTQLIDVLGFQIADGQPNIALVVRVFALVTSLGAAGALAVFGLFARRGGIWAFVIVGAGYALDTLLVLFFGDYLGALFHALGLFYIGRGALAAYRFNRSLRPA
jgi:hypothetical protein